jgi:FKBP-type peptidyl-prolyl cis-trans isomerase (trigger factor)
MNAGPGKMQKPKKTTKPKMDASLMKGTIKEQSHAHALEIEVPQITLEAKFAEYWNQVKDVLPPNIVKAATKGGFREVSRKRAVAAAGGKAQFFGPVLAEVVNTYLDGQPRQALLIVSVDLVELENCNFLVRSLVHLEPEVKWKAIPGIEAPIVVKVPKHPDGWVDLMVLEYLKKNQEDSVVLVPIPDDSTILADGHVALLNCQSLIGGIPWEQGTFTNKKWPINRAYYRQPELYDTIVGMKKGDEKTITFTLGEVFGEDRGKTVQATIRINQVFTKDTPEINDDLSMNFGYKTLDAWKVGIKTELERKIAEQQNNLVSINTMASLVNPEAVDVDPIPFNWMTEKAKAIYGSLRQKVPSEDELVKKFAGQRTTTGEEVKDKNTILTYLGEKAAQSLIHDLVLRSWGQKAGVEGDFSLSNIDEYITKVREKLESVVKIEEFVVGAALPAQEPSKPHGMGAVAPPGSPWQEGTIVGEDGQPVQPGESNADVPVQVPTQEV